MAKVKPRIPLSPELIYQTAFELIEQTGLEKFSMRTLATRLGVDPMAVYHHIPSKAALMEGIYDTIFGELFIASETLPNNWQDKLLELAYRFRALALRHHKLFPSLIASNHIGHNELKALDTLLGTLLEAGLDPITTVQVGDSLFALVTGFAILEISDLQNITPHTGTERLAAEAETDFINTRNLLEPLTNNSFSSSFETGLQLIIAGIKAKLDKN
jgi:AcrR family transcriptional regulator